MLKHYALVCALLLGAHEISAQSCTLTEADLTAAPAGNYTIPAGAVLCIGSNYCMGAVAGVGCPTNITSITVNGVLRIFDNITFSFSGTINGTGTIQLFDRSRISLFGSISCAAGLEIRAVDRTLPIGTTGSVSLPSCSSPGCEPTFTDGYSPFGIISNGLGYTSSGCNISSSSGNLFVVPVTFTDFKGFAEGTGYRLNWKTASEIQNKGFEVQRSNAEGGWEYAGWVGSKAPEGNSTTVLEYQFNDVNAGTVASLHYRLKQTDIDNNFKYSPVIRIEALRSNGWRLTAEPGTVRLQVQSGGTENVTISVVNAAGHLLYRKSIALNAGVNQLLIPSGSWAKGVHIVTMQNRRGGMKREKLLIR